MRDRTKRKKLINKNKTKCFRFRERQLLIEKNQPEKYKTFGLETERKKERKKLKSQENIAL